MIFYIIQYNIPDIKINSCKASNWQTNDEKSYLPHVSQWAGEWQSRPQVEHGTWAVPQLEEGTLSL